MKGLLLAFLLFLFACKSQEQRKKDQIKTLRDSSSALVDESQRFKDIAITYANIGDMDKFIKFSHIGDSLFLQSLYFYDSAYVLETGHKPEGGETEKFARRFKQDRVYDSLALRQNNPQPAK